MIFHIARRNNQEFIEEALIGGGYNREVAESRGSS
jgi:hypothetical protein